LRNYFQGQPKIMRCYGDSLLRTVTYDVLAELFGNENDSVVVRAIPWAVSNAFYEQIVLHYGLENLKPQLSLVDSKGLTVKRGDVLEAYMAGIVMDVSREAGEGYQEIRTWFYKIIRLRLRKACFGSSPALLPALEDLGWKSHTIGNAVRTQLSEIRQSVFANMKEMMGQVQWSSPSPTVSQLMDFWSRVKCYLDGLCANLLPSDEAQVIVLHYYRVHLD
jgi:hypothetical protein